MSRLTRTAVALACAGGLTASGLLAASGATASAAGPSRLVIPVDRQDYTTIYSTTNPTDGTTVDNYGSDPSSIHVAIQGGQEYAQSYVHLALDYLPRRATPTAAVMTLYVTQQSDAGNKGVYNLYNVNADQAIVEACALTTELPSKFDPQKPPGYDCQHGSAVGKRSSDGTSWTFDLSELLGYWKQHGNTGAALIPVGAGDPTQNWQVAFYRSRSTSRVTYLPLARPASRTGPSPAPAPAGTGPAAGRGAVPASGSGGPAAPPPGPPPAGRSTGVTAPPTGTAPSIAAAPASVNPPAEPGKSSGGSSPVWPWVLLASLAVAGGSVGFAHRAAIVAAMPRLSSLWRTHPRAYTVAAAATAWGLVFTGYSAVTPTSHGEQQMASSPQPTAPGATPGQATTTTGGAAALPGRSAGRPASQPVGSAGTAVATTGAAAHANPSVAAAQTEFSGAGTYKVIDGIRVFFPADGGAPVARLWSGADDIEGLSSDQIRICAHAALTYGAAFHISASDLDVFWTKVNKELGGIYGRQVKTNYQNDNYDPGTAVQAAQTCKDWGTFLLLGGIGFDQIPAVRQWAEQNHMLYLHHIATVQGSAGLRYSFTMLPSVEQMGVQLGQIAARELAGKKIAIIYRQSSNWTPALAPFKRIVEAAGSTIVGEYGVQINQGNYTQELTEARSAGAQVVLSWENSLSEIEMIKQAQSQNWHPAWLVNGFNIITNTLGSTALDQDMWSAGDWDAYDPGYYGGGFASYAAEIHEFEAEYKKYDPGADLSGDGGDLLFLNWEAQKWLYRLLLVCGKDCTRNKMAGLMLAGYHTTVPPNCPAAFGAKYDHHHAGYLFNVLHAVRDPNGRANFVPVARCVRSF